MDLGLKGKRVLVTGSTAGIGHATAVAFAREGAAVAINGRTRPRVEEAITRLRALVPEAQVTAAPGDVSTAAGAGEVLAAMPDVDVLVNNAGIFEPKPFAEIPDEDWTRFFETNVLSGVRMARHHFPRMLARGWGRVIFVSSESGLQIPPEMIHYGMTKTAQLAIARGLAELTRGTAVTVNSVLPGPTSSEGVATFVGELARSRGMDAAAFEKEFFEKGRPTSLLRRFETAEEIASVIVFVASARASAINGASVRADGGVVLSIG